ncbi:uncharacterized protein LOC126581574 [Anopheles aquasalis]|uniref:uncharacterized protein LOC126581574 n=1 Tax=Anopheles aquasalis TaxID=42839 RepID=UPI00215B6AC2|nr:uncharacterized protein LOC126581574 [Anopheles aquasalis]
MGNCLKGCLPRHNQGGCSRRTARLNASDSQYEILIEGATDHHRRTDEQEDRGAIRSKATGKSKFFRKFWIGNRDVDYARLNKASNSNNNFTKRPSSGSGRNAGTGATDGGGSSKHNQHTTAAAAAGFDIQLQCLDAHSLLLVSKDGPRKATNGQGCSSDLLQTDQTSSPGSSLDLEWENDYGGYPQTGCQWAFTQQHQQQQQHQEETLGATATAHLVSFPVAIQESVFKIEEWSMVKKSKDRINALRRLDHPPPPANRGGEGGGEGGGNTREEVAGSLECLRRMPPLSAPFERRSTFSLNSVERTEAYGGSSDLSHISSSTPDGSLEWDIDQDRQLKSEHDGESEIDFETKELLLEIEQLKNRVLNETGASLRDDHAMIS